MSELRVFLHLQDSVGQSVLQNPRGVADGAAHQRGVALGRCEVTLLDGVMHDRLTGHHEARAHADPLGAQC
ncbi:hypothetical protein D3C78_1881680 [compost metagenome]